MTTGIHPAYKAISSIQNVAAGFSARAICDLKNCEYKKVYVCGLVECLTANVCEYSINCGDAGLFCRHPSVKYTEQMIRALLEFK